MDTIVICVETQPQHPQHQYFPECHSRTAFFGADQGFAIGLYGTHILQDGKYPFPEFRLHINVLKAAQEARNIIPRLEINLDDGWFRVMYVAKFPEAVYVLHCFKKKTTSTSKHDKDITATRYKSVIQERSKK